MTGRLTLLLLFLSISTLSAAPPPQPIGQIRRVLIISIDGLRPDLLLRGHMPAVRKLLTEGSYTFWARTTAASTTLPSHVSMLTGVTPEVHGIVWNADLPLTRPIYPAAATLFEMAKRYGYTTALAAGKNKFAMMNKPGSIDWRFVPASEKCENPEVMASALTILREHQPHVMFIHLPSVDNSGHSKGWGSPEQMAAIEQSDGCVRQIMDALDELKLADQTLLILTSDHGGAGRTHGPEDPRSRTIPWIAHGPGVRRGFDLTRLPDLNVETFDTFATSCAMLGIPVARRISGKFVSQILENQDLINPTSQPTTAAATIPATAPTTQEANR